MNAPKSLEEASAAARDALGARAHTPSGWVFKVDDNQDLATSQTLRGTWVREAPKERKSLAVQIGDVIAQLHAVESCAAAVIEGQMCGPCITAKWAARELRRILAAHPEIK